MCWAWTGEHDLPCRCTPRASAIFAMTRTRAPAESTRRFLLEVDRMYIIIMAMPRRASVTGSSLSVALGSRHLAHRKRVSVEKAAHIARMRLRSRGSPLFAPGAPYGAYVPSEPCFDEGGEPRLPFSNCSCSHSVIAHTAECITSARAWC